MARSAHLPIAADRYEACVRQIIFRGIDLREVPLRAQVRLSADTPGAPLADLQTVINGNAEGLRVVDYQLLDGVPVTVLEFVINETTMEAMPYTGEVGDATPLAYDLQGTFAGRKRKLVHGAFVVLPGVTGADDAPANRPSGCDRSHGGSTWSTATLTFSDDKAEVTLAGLDLIDGVVAGLAAARQDARARMAARALLYGVANTADARLFAAEATELAFSDDYYREGYMAHDELYKTSGWAINGTPVVIDGRGLPVSGSTAPVLFRPTAGDVTFIVEADLPAHDGAVHVIASFVGPVLENRVTVYRNDVGIYALQVFNNEQGLQVAAGPTDLTARRMRVAVTIGAGRVAASFAGATPIIITAKQPALLRLWLGTLALGYGDTLNGFIRRVAFLPYAVSGALLQSMSGGPVTDDEVSQLIDQKIRTHDNDRTAHELVALRRQADLADSKTGLWSIKVADTFTGADGSPLGNAETGGMAWTSPAGLVRKGGWIQHPTNGFGGAWLQSGVKDGQVEADLYPGTSEASLYCRLNAATTQWLLLQRAVDGAITLNLQFGGQTIRLSPPFYAAVEAGERFKLRFLGPRIWAFRVMAGVETLLFDVTEPRLMNETIHGIRLNGGGSADNFRVLSREAL